MGSPFPITPLTITSAAPALWTDGTTSYLFDRHDGEHHQAERQQPDAERDEQQPGIGGGGGSRSRRRRRGVFAADSGGNVWAFDPNNFTGTNRRVAAHGGRDGHDPELDPVLRLGGRGDSLRDGAGEGRRPERDDGRAADGLSVRAGCRRADAIRSAPLYINGILLVGTTTGKLYFYDRNNGTTGPAFIKQYYFGPTQAVSGIGYDSNVQRYMVSTADPTTKDGRAVFHRRDNRSDGGEVTT